MGKLVHMSSTGSQQQQRQQLHCMSTSSLDAWKESEITVDLRDSDQGFAYAQGFGADNTCIDGGGWETVKGLESQPRSALCKLASKGVLWKHPTKAFSRVFSLHHGGEVEADGNCLFTASLKAMHLKTLSPLDIRFKTVARFLTDYAAWTKVEQNAVDSSIRHLYNPDLSSGWGVHVVQEIKLLAKKSDRESLDAAIKELEQTGMPRSLAAEIVYKERCIAVKDGETWAKYMSIGGSVKDEYDIITLQYTEEGLLSVDENRNGIAAAFGDDIAIASLATEFKREIFVVQAHGTDGMVDEENCVFFLPHPPRSEIQGPPVFLFMKGTGWCGAGADHYEPLIAYPLSMTKDYYLVL